MCAMQVNKGANSALLEKKIVDPSTGKQARIPYIQRVKSIPEIINTKHKTPTYVYTYQETGTSDD